jgi:hypothetical protein
MKIVPCCPPYNPHLETQIRSPTIFDHIAQDCSHLHCYLARNVLCLFCLPAPAQSIAMTAACAFFLNAQRSVFVHNVHAVLHLDLGVALDLFVTAALLSFTRNYTQMYGVRLSRPISTSMTGSATYITGFRLPARWLS